MTPQERKRHYRAFRLAASKLYERPGTNFTVAKEANVQIMSDGAFVEIVVWIPRDELTPDIHNEVLKMEQDRR